MAESPAPPSFQAWLLDRMVAYDFTPMRLAAGLGVLDGAVEDWIAGRSVPSPAECQRLAQLFEIPVRVVEAATGGRPLDPGA